MLPFVPAQKIVHTQQQEYLQQVKKKLDIVMRNTISTTRNKCTHHSHKNISIRFY